MNLRIPTLMLMLIFFVSACREKYYIAYEEAETGYLVVEGFVNTSGKTEIRISRTTVLNDRTLTFEKGAAVMVEGEDNTSYPLSEADSGNYVAPSLPLENTTRYRVRIVTLSGKKYVSEFLDPLTTPPIDSLTWQRKNGGVNIFVNANNADKKNTYYKWDYEETWEIRSYYKTSIEIVEIPPGGGASLLELRWTDPVTFMHDSSRYICWKSRKSSAIHVGTTDKLSENKVFAPLIFHGENVAELNWLYSVLVKQRVISKDEYEFYQKMKKNTEQLGSIFDAQPSDIVGNIKNIEDPTEPVIGHIEVSSQTAKRLFISVEELPGWSFAQGCESEEIFPNIPDSLSATISFGLIPTRPEVLDFRGGILSFRAAHRECVDCTLNGSNVKPVFWPW